MQDWKKDRREVVFHPLAGYYMAILVGTIQVRLYSQIARALQERQLALRKFHARPKEPEHLLGL